MTDDLHRRRKIGKPGEPYIVLREAEAEWLVLFGWEARKKLFRRRFDLRAHEIVEPEEETI